MDEQELSIQAHFADVTDPRKAWNQDHRLSDILVMALCGIICGTDSWGSVAAFAEAKLPWFRRFLELPNGAPSHDTFSWVFAALDPKQLQLSGTVVHGFFRHFGDVHSPRPQATSGPQPLAGHQP